MGTWVLILTLYNGGVTSIPGFSSGASCVDAGNAWLKKVNVMGSPAYANCIQVK